MNEMKLHDYQQDVVNELKKRITDNPRQLMIIGTPGFSGSRIMDLMAEPIAGDWEPMIIDPMHADTGTNAAALIDDPMTDADRDRAIWNEAVDQRKADRKQRRRVEAMRVSIDKLIPAWMREGGAS